MIVLWAVTVMEIRLMDSQKLLQTAVKVFANPSRLKRKKSLIIFPGIGVFILTRPLMGDPSPKFEPKSSPKDRFNLVKHQKTPQIL